jgi:hypothetical protein
MSPKLKSTKLLLTQEDTVKEEEVVDKETLVMMPEELIDK